MRLKFKINCIYCNKNDNGKTEAKHQCMIKNNVKIITDFKIFFEHVHNKYGKTYLSNFKT